MKSKTAEQIHAKWQEIWVTGKRPDLNANEHQIEMIKEYASQFQHPAPPSGEDAGKGIGDLKQDLFDFFLWFRENGDLYIDKSIENMISIYIKTIHTNV